ncbi:hypothetical protein [Pararobbsia silviterrae]|uniref:Replication protein n=1 Tax=Pararobbsia silviterrae TaxID=1792498 RepID=A0A494X2X3_9BURK|nr:hypothetical protein [Pararobbsia silviterrae]RKP44712.1 hypothetical protein D7S86_27170 [Pararobbsia silviterrae]
MTTHHFEVDDAVRYGVNAAVILQNLRFWILHNKANGKHQHQGRTWTFNSARAFSLLFPYLSADQVKRILRKLVDEGVLLARTLAEDSWDRVNWYAFDDESKHLAQPETPVAAHGANSPNASGGIAPSMGRKRTVDGAKSPNHKTDVNTDKKRRSKSISAAAQPDDDFEQAWALYPSRGGGNSKADALKAWKARIAAGDTAAQMLEGVQRYAVFCDKTGKLGTEYVKQAKTFFGPSRHFADAWPVPVASAPAARDDTRFASSRSIVGSASPHSVGARDDGKTIDADARFVN